MVDFYCREMTAPSPDAHAADPVHTDGEKYKVRFENEKVRVLDYRDKPGERTHQHAHPNFVLYAAALAMGLRLRRKRKWTGISGF